MAPGRGPEEGVNARCPIAKGVHGATTRIPDCPLKIGSGGAIDICSFAKTLSGPKSTLVGGHGSALRIGLGTLMYDGVFNFRAPGAILDALRIGLETLIYDWEIAQNRSLR